jgi:hypothetical protein
LRKQEWEINLRKQEWEIKKELIFAVVILFPKKVKFKSFLASFFNGSILNNVYRHIHVFIRSNSSPMIDIQSWRKKKNLYGCLCSNVGSSWEGKRSGRLLALVPKKLTIVQKL